MTPNENPTGRLIHLSDDGKSTYYMCFTCHEKFNSREAHDAHLKETGHIKCPHYIARPRKCSTCDEVFHTDADPDHIWGDSLIPSSSMAKLHKHGKETGHYVNVITDEDIRMNSKDLEISILLEKITELHIHGCIDITCDSRKKTEKTFEVLTADEKRLESLRKSKDQEILLLLERIKELNEWTKHLQLVLSSQYKKNR